MPRRNERPDENRSEPPGRQSARTAAEVVDLTDDTDITPPRQRRRLSNSDSDLLEVDVRVRHPMAQQQQQRRQQPPRRTTLGSQAIRHARPSSARVGSPGFRMNSAAIRFPGSPIIGLGYHQLQHQLQHHYNQFSQLNQLHQHQHQHQHQHNQHQQQHEEAVLRTIALNLAPGRRLPIPNANWMLAEEDRQMREALLQSMNMEQPHGNIGLEDIKDAPEVPQETRKGFTRAINGNDVLLCAHCDVHLGEGLADETDEDKKRNRENDVTDGDLLLSKRVFFAKCGHVYCGMCVHRIMNRKRDRKIPSSCVVEGCNVRFRISKKKPFMEIYY